MMQDWSEHQEVMYDITSDVCIALTTCTMILSVQPQSIKQPITIVDEVGIESTTETEITWNEIYKQFHKIQEWMD
jgi:hypothetical protein